MTVEELKSVFLVVYETWDYSDVCSAFTTEEAAEKEVKRLKGKYKRDGSYSIKEIEVQE